jgi:hypothetical protein
MVLLPIGWALPIPGAAHPGQEARPRRSRLASVVGAALVPTLLHPGRMRRSTFAQVTAKAAVITALLVWARPGTGHASLRATCPEYLSVLRAAKASLERGDRAGAIAALREAQQALGACIRREAEETALAYAGARETPNGGVST